MNTSIINKSLRWSFLGEVVSRLAQPLTFLYLMAVLGPGDYGVVAAAAMVIAFTQIFWEAGLGKALIQYEGNKKEAASTAFLLNVALGVVVSLILWLSAEFIAVELFKDLRVKNVLRLLIVQVALTAITATQVALMQEEFNFKGIFFAKFTQAVIPSVVSIFMASSGYGYWALVAGSIVGAAAHTLIIWSVSDWRPKAIFCIRTAKRLLAFGSWVMYGGLLTWFYMWADSLIISLNLTSQELGSYRTGSQVTGMVFSLILSPILPVTYSYLTKIKGEKKEKIGDQMKKIITSLSLLCFPLAAFMYIVVGPLTEYILPNKWNGLGGVISIIGVMQGISTIVGVNGEAYRSIGKPKYETFVNSIMIFVYLPVYFFSIEYGFEVFLWARLGLAALALCIHMALLSKVFGLTVRGLAFPVLRFGAGVAVVSGFAAWIGGFVNNEISSIGLRFLALICSIGVLIYLINPGIFDLKILNPKKTKEIK